VHVAPNVRGSSHLRGGYISPSLAPALLLFSNTLVFHQFPKEYDLQAMVCLSCLPRNAKWSFPCCLLLSLPKHPYSSIMPASAVQDVASCLNGRRSSFQNSRPDIHVGKESSRNFRKVRTENTTATYLCILALGFRSHYCCPCWQLICGYKIWSLTEHVSCITLPIPNYQKHLNGGSCAVSLLKSTFCELMGGRTVRLPQSQKLEILLS